MKWSWRVGRIAGIDVFIHATFVLLLAWVALAEFQRGGTAASALAGVGFIVAVFAIVLMHEYGHALAARRYGIATRDITLLPIGGVARLERMPREPRQELVVALAGPAVNVALAAIIRLILVGTEPAGDATAPLTLDRSFMAWSFLRRLYFVNVSLALFNLIPAFPMDGGRVLRALLAMRSGDYTRATDTAARVGRFFALVFGIVGLFVMKDAFLVFIALFVWLGAAGEAAAVQTSSMLDGVPLAQVMITDVRTLAPGDPLSRAMQLILAGFQQDFPVVEGGIVVGMLTRKDLVRGVAEQGPGAPVAGVMQRQFQVATPEEPIEEALGRLKASAGHAMPVVRGGQLLGVLTTENVGEFIMLRTALRGTPMTTSPA